MADRTSHLFGSLVVALALAVPPVSGAELVEIFSNFNSDPDNLYAYGGYAVHGSQAPDRSSRQSLALSFVPTQDASVRKIQLALNHIGGPNRYQISLRESDGDLPGAELEAFVVIDTPFFRTCCEVVSVHGKQA